MARSWIVKQFFIPVRVLTQEEICVDKERFGLVQKAFDLVAVGVRVFVIDNEL